MAKQWAIMKVPGDQDWRCVQLTGKKNGRNSYGEVREQQVIPYECRGKVYLCFWPQEFHLLTEPFPVMKPELLSLQINKRFNDLGLSIEGGIFEHRAVVFDAARSEQSCLFVRKEELDELHDLIRPWPGIRDLRLVPLAAAIAGLFAKVTSEAVITLFLGKKSSQVLVVKNGCPLYYQILTQAGDGVVEESLVAHAIDFARMSVRKQHEIDEFHIVKLGPFRKNLDLDELGIREWKPDLSPICSPDRDEDVLNFPGIFGAPFAVAGYDFLPKMYRTSWKIQSVSQGLAVCSGVVGALLLGGWLYLQPQVSALKSNYNQLLADIAGDQQHLRAEMPSDVVLDNFSRLLKIRNLANQELRLDHLARMISLALPAHVSVIQLEIRRKSDEDDGTQGVPVPGDDPALLDGSAPMPQTDTPQSVPEKLQASPLELNCVAVSTGSHDEVIDRFEQAINGMNRFFDIQDMNWTYREEEQTGQLRFAFKPLMKQVQQ